MGPKRQELLIAPRCVLCRTCANYLGRVARPERRVSPRTCAAGQFADARSNSCESFVPIRLVPDFKGKPQGPLFRPDRMGGPERGRTASRRP